MRRMPLDKFVEFVKFKLTNADTIATIHHEEETIMRIPTITAPSIYEALMSRNGCTMRKFVDAYTLRALADAMATPNTDARP